MDFKRQKVRGGFSRYRLIITLGLAVFLPAAALIYINFSQLRAFERDKYLEATIRQDFMELLAISEKSMGKKVYAQIEQARDSFPSPDYDQPIKEQQLEEVLSRSPSFTHAFLFDEEGMMFRTQRSQGTDMDVRKEHEEMSESYETWFSSKEGKGFVETLNKKPHRIHLKAMPVHRMGVDGPAYMLIALFVLPDVSPKRVVIGGLFFDPCYLKNNFLPEMLEASVNEKTSDQGGNRIAMMIFVADQMDGQEKPIVASTGWDEGKPEVVRKMEVLPGLAMGIKYQGVSVKALGEAWVRRSFVLLGILSLMFLGGLVLTKHMVSKEMAVAKLKSDFVSNVSHELRTPLALIRLYAETLELGRITTQEKKHEYYKIIRKESERLTGLINNILDFSRIEAGHKEYEFRETDIADLVRNTLDSYRYQIEQQGFTLKEEIDESLPAVCVDREAIARALLNLMNNALKYSPNEKFLRVKLYRENGSVKLEIEDHGIGITSREQTKIFEKFYRTGDPLVHNTKGSGLGLSLVRHISDAHGGSIDVDSTPGKGSRFTLTLPLNGKTRPAAAHN